MGPSLLVLVPLLALALLLVLAVLLPLPPLLVVVAAAVPAVPACLLPVPLAMLLRLLCPRQTRPRPLAS